MRLVIATPLYPPEPGGPATYAKLLEEGLVLEGVRVSAVVKFSAVRKRPKLIRHIAYAYEVFSAARSADGILALDPVSVGFPVWIASLFSGKPYVVKIVGDYAWEQGVQRFSVGSTLDEFQKENSSSLSVFFLKLIQRLVARCARAIIVPSDYLKGIVTGWGIREEKISVIYNAVSIGAIGTVPEAVGQLTQPLVVTAGRLVPWKNMPGVIDAVQALQKDGVAVSLAIVGDGPERAEIERYAARAKHVVLTGELSHADTLAVIDRADVFVLNSSYEGLSHLLIEAVSLGVPTLATDVGGNKEIITHNVNGLLVPPGNARELEKAIRHLFDKSEAERLSSESVKTAERFSLSRMLAETAELLKTI